MEEVELHFSQKTVVFQLVVEEGVPDLLYLGVKALVLIIYYYLLSLAGIILKVEGVVPEDLVLVVEAAVLIIEEVVVVLLILIHLAFQVVVGVAFHHLEVEQEEALTAQKVEVGVVFPLLVGSVAEPQKTYLEVVEGQNC